METSNVALERVTVRLSGGYHNIPEVRQTFVVEDVTWDITENNPSAVVKLFEAH